MSSTLDLVIERTSEQWFPVNPELLQQINRRLSCGDYNTNRERLINDLQQDPSLFLLCLKRLLTLAKNEGRDCSKLGEIFRTTDLAVFRSAMPRKASDASIHSLDTMNSAQASRLRQTNLSATTAQILAEKTTNDPMTAFSCAILRQLGLTLIAWNYPNVFANLISHQQPGTKIDDLLAKTLGFSPTLLGVVIARKWGCSPVILDAVGSDTENLTDKERRTAETFTKICEIGELFAKAAGEEDYPEQRGDWQNALFEIAEYAGSTELISIKESLFKACKKYIKFAPALLNWSIEGQVSQAATTNRFTDNASAEGYQAIIESSEISNKLSPRALITKNVDLSACSTEHRSHIITFYDRLAEEKLPSCAPTRDLILEFAEKLVAKCGFNGLAIYMLDIESAYIKNRYYFGSIRFINNIDSNSNLGISQELLKSAFLEREPLLTDEFRQSSVKRGAILGSFGQAQRIGVVGMEWDAISKKLQNFDPLTTFKALRIALEQTLSIG